MEDQVQAAKRGDRPALDQLVRQHYGAVYRFCVRRVGLNFGEDAAQETFVTMQQSLKRYEGRSKFETWLLGIAHNVCLKAARQRKSDPAPLCDWLDTGGDGPDIAARQDLVRALNSLTEQHRQVVLMHEVEGWKYSEIAEILGIPEGTVKSRLHLAFRQLRTELPGGQS